MKWYVVLTKYIATDSNTVNITKIQHYRYKKSSKYHNMTKIRNKTKRLGWTSVVGEMRENLRALPLCSSAAAAGCWQQQHQTANNSRSVTTYTASGSKCQK